MEAVLCSEERTDDYRWIINEVYVQTLRPSYLHLSRTDGQSAEKWSNNKIILQNDVLNYLVE